MFLPRSAIAIIPIVRSTVPCRKTTGLALTSSKRAIALGIILLTYSAAE
ncbi:MAG: hypothetical protein AAF383_16380 [Cyanobacteria bacterium P01_A01_bin.83]